MNKLLKILLGLAAVVALAAAYLLNPRLPEPEGAQSAALYRPGELGVSRDRIELLDPSRPTQANGDFQGSDYRELNGFVWYPQTQAQKPFPLIVYSHGFMSSVAEPEYLVDFLVPKGYLLVAVNYPLSHGGAPGGPLASDVINQANDLSFVLDAILARNTDPDDSLYGLVDPDRIAAVGLSLGGLTTQLAAFHRERRDPRLDVAVSIAGPSAGLEQAFFTTTNIPFMMIAGDSDAIVPYAANAAPIPDKADNSLLVTLADASHTGFAGMATIAFRWFNHPDALVCPLLLDRLNGNESGNHAPAPLLAADPSAGISADSSRPCRMQNFERAMRPAQQQMLTRLALYAFLEAHFAEDPARRQQMARYLRAEFPAENPAVKVEAASRADGE